MTRGGRTEPISAEPGGEALGLVLDAGCPLCSYIAENETRYLTWFRIESHRTEEVTAQLRAALGFCPAHTRGLLSGADSMELVARVQRTVVGRAVREFDELEPIGQCPACASLDQNRDYCGETIASALGRDEIRDAFAASGGYCLPHLLDRLGRDSATPARVELDVALAGLRDGSMQIAGNDHDAARRHRLRSILPDAGVPGASSARSSLGRFAQRFEEPTCPLCLARWQAEGQYLSWLVANVEDQQVPYLCPLHLHDLDQLSAAAAALVADGVGARWTSPLEEARRLLESAKPARRALRDARELLSTSSICAACRSMDSVEQRELGLLEAVATDTRFVRAYERSHGLCLRHLLMSRSRGGIKPLEDVTRARLAVLDWELREEHHKRAWDYRHETPGPEQSAGIRAAGAVDGRAFLGVPPLAAVKADVFN